MALTHSSKREEKKVRIKEHEKVEGNSKDGIINSKMKQNKGTRKRIKTLIQISQKMRKIRIHPLVFEM